MSEPRSALVFKIADEHDEFEGIHALNYRTFVEEIPQHAPREDRRLVDKFHEQNTYAVCVAHGQVVGMLAGRVERPFSLEQKLGPLDGYLPAHQRAVELRLLAVAPAWRKPGVFAGLVRMLAAHYLARGHDLALVSGTVRQLHLYEHLGFTPFGPRVGTPGAEYQPMYADMAGFAGTAHAVTRLQARAQSPVNLLPGPVAMSRATSLALRREAVSHRSGEFAAMHAAVRRKLCEMTGAFDVHVMSGSGTLANDAVAAQLAAGGDRGLVLQNGEFGARLADHARRWRLDFDTHAVAWGHAFDPHAVAGVLARDKAIRWVWMAACETSTGVVNHTGALSQVCEESGAAVYLDAVSALGCMPLSLTGVHLATATSGKGLAAAAGLAFVFRGSGPAPESGRAVPRALDLSLYQQGGGVPFTLSSALLAAAWQALDSTDWERKYSRAAEAGAWLRRELAARSIGCVATDDGASRFVVTLKVPEPASSLKAAEAVRRSGYLLAHESDYLRQRNWVQACFFGDVRIGEIEGLPDAIAAAIRH